MTKRPIFLGMATVCSVAVALSIFLGSVTAPVALADGVGQTKVVTTEPPDLCGPPQGALPPDYEGYPTQLPEDTGGTAVTKRAEAPKSANPVRKVCENGRIEIRVGSHRNYTYRTLDMISVTIIIEAEKNIRFDYTSLMQKTLAFDGSDFTLWAEPKESVFITETALPSGKVERRINLLIQSSVVDKESIVFQLNLRYSTRVGPDGKTPEWKVLVTPDFVIGRVKTLDTSDELLESDMSYRPERVPFPAYPMAILGIALIICVPGFFLVQYINRVRPRKVLPPKAAAWKDLEAVFAEGKTGEGSYLFSKVHCNRIAFTLRKYLEATTGLPIESSTLLELQDRLENHPGKDLIIEVLTACEHFVFLDKAVTALQSREIVEAIETLIPLPWEKQ